MICEICKEEIDLEDLQLENGKNYHECCIGNNGIVDPLELWEERLENFEMDPDDYKEAYREYLGDMETENEMSFTPRPALGFDSWFKSCDKEDDPKYQVILERVKELQDERGIEL